MAINRETLDGLRALQVDGEPDVLKELIRVFMETAPALLKDIERAMTERNPKSISSGAHSLRSCAQALGADLLGEICYKLEKAPSTDMAGQLLKQLQAEFSNVISELQSIAAA